jgi:hypothetical protein
LQKRNDALVQYAKRCQRQMEGDYASKKLMDAENGRLRGTHGLEVPDRYGKPND